MREQMKCVEVVITRLVDAAADLVVHDCVLALLAVLFCSGSEGRCGPQFSGHGYCGNIAFCRRQNLPDRKSKLCKYILFPIVLTLPILSAA